MAWPLDLESESRILNRVGLIHAEHHARHRADRRGIQAVLRADLPRRRDPHRRQQAGAWSPTGSGGGCEPRGSNHSPSTTRFLTSPAGSGEMPQFLDAITTNETYFFRDTQHFDWLGETFLPEIAEQAAATEAAHDACGSGRRRAAPARSPTRSP